MTDNKRKTDDGALHHRDSRRVEPLPHVSFLCFLFFFHYLLQITSYLRDDDEQTTKRVNECRLHDRGSTRLEPLLYVSFYLSFIFYITNIYLQLIYVTTRKQAKRGRYSSRGSRRVEPLVYVSFLFLFYILL